MKYHDENIIPEVLDVIEKSLRLYYLLKGAEELDETQVVEVKALIDNFLSQHKDGTRSRHDS